MGKVKVKVKAKRMASRRRRTARRRTLPSVRLGDRGRLRRELHAANPNCHWCRRPTRIIAPARGERAPGDMATFEHLTPECRGGGMGSNLAIACSRCNSMRGDYPTLGEALRAHAESARARLDSLRARDPSHSRRLAIRRAGRKLRDIRTLLAAVANSPPTV